MGSFKPFIPSLFLLPRHSEKKLKRQKYWVGTCNQSLSSLHNCMYSAVPEGQNTWTTQNLFYEKNRFSPAQRWVKPPVCLQTRLSGSHDSHTLVSGSSYGCRETQTHGALVGRSAGTARDKRSQVLATQICHSSTCPAPKAILPQKTEGGISRGFLIRTPWMTLWSGNPTT